MHNIYFIIFALLIILYIFYSIRKNKLSIANSFIWIVFCIILLILSIWPTSLDWLANVLGIAYPPALFLTIAVVILFVMNFVQSKKIEDLHKKVIDLGQELSILKSTQKESPKPKTSKPKSKS
ncbi:DUF2304 domain-containing protein [Candidatus Saccharibacteria bacterium]|nr:DUF2304 domain-containing protein [Candidatus Saccharibacteria bacterium]